MDKKILAIIAVAIIVVAGVATYFVVSNDKETATYNEGSYNMLARVNAEGSGIYIKESKIDSYDNGIPVRNGAKFYNIVDGKYVIDESNKAAWAGLKLGTPGATSIQHIQIITLAKQMGLDMVNVASTSGSDPAKSIYFNATITNYTTAVDIKNDIDGGIVWEPQYSKIIAAGNPMGYKELALTNNLFPDHTCCTIIGNHNYIGNNEDVTVRFLAGYVDAVKYIQKALTKQGDAYVNTTEYNKLVEICVKYTNGLSESEIKAALSNINYLYADDANGSLSTLTKDIESLASNLKSVGATTKDTNPGALSKTFVNDSYMKKAVNYTYTGKDTKTIRVAVIDGDIHQIGIRVAVELGYFTNYGINVNISTGLANGGAVADALIGGQADFGFIGAPPATLKTINAPLIKV